MTEEILVETTRSFDKDLKKLSEKEQNLIAEKLNFLISSIREKGNTKQLYRLHKLKLPNDLSSSLFVFKIDVQLRAILTFEKDPLFNQSVMTLMRVVKHSDLDKTFNSVSESLYQNMLQGIKESIIEVKQAKKEKRKLQTLTSFLNEC